jgi:hypothetical protein
MNHGDKMTEAELNTLINSHREGTALHGQERSIIGILDNIGRMIGYGRIAQIAEHIRNARLYGQTEAAAGLKRERFSLLGWPLPDNFEEVAKK